MSLVILFTLLILLSLESTRYFYQNPFLFFGFTNALPFNPLSIPFSSPSSSPTLDSTAVFTSINVTCMNLSACYFPSIIDWNPSWKFNEYILLIQVIKNRIQDDILSICSDLPISILSDSFGVTLLSVNVTSLDVCIQRFLLYNENYSWDDKIFNRFNRNDRYNISSLIDKDYYQEHVHVYLYKDTIDPINLLQKTNINIWINLNSFIPQFSSSIPSFIVIHQIKTINLLDGIYLIYLSPSIYKFQRYKTFKLIIQSMNEVGFLQIPITSQLEANMNINSSIASGTSTLSLYGDILTLNSYLKYVEYVVTTDSFQRNQSMNESILILQLFTFSKVNGSDDNDDDNDDDNNNGDIFLSSHTINLVISIQSTFSSFFLSPSSSLFDIDVSTVQFTNSMANFYVTIRYNNKWSLNDSLPSNIDKQDEEIDLYHCFFYLDVGNIYIPSSLVLPSVKAIDQMKRYQLSVFVKSNQVGFYLLKVGMPYGNIFNSSTFTMIQIFSNYTQIDIKNAIQDSVDEMIGMDRVVINVKFHSSLYLISIYFGSDKTNLPFYITSQGKELYLVDRMDLPTLEIMGKENMNVNFTEVENFINENLLDENLLDKNPSRSFCSFSICSYIIIGSMLELNRAFQSIYYQPVVNSIRSIYSSSIIIVVYRHGQNVEERQVLLGSYDSNLIFNYSSMPYFYNLSVEQQIYYGLEDRELLISGISINQNTITLPTSRNIPIFPIQDYVFVSVNLQLPSVGNIRLLNTKDVIVTSLDSHNISLLGKISNINIALSTLSFTPKSNWNSALDLPSLSSSSPSSSSSMPKNNVQRIKFVKSFIETVYTLHIQSNESIIFGNDSYITIGINASSFIDDFYFSHIDYSHIPTAYMNIFVNSSTNDLQRSLYDLLNLLKIQIKTLNVSNDNNHDRFDIYFPSIEFVVTSNEITNTTITWKILVLTTDCSFDIWTNSFLFFIKTNHIQTIHDTNVSRVTILQHLVNNQYVPNTFRLVYGEFSTPDLIIGISATSLQNAIESLPPIYQVSVQMLPLSTNHDDNNKQHSCDSYYYEIMFLTNVNWDNFDTFYQEIAFGNQVQPFVITDYDHSKFQVDYEVIDPGYATSVNLSIILQDIYRNKMSSQTVSIYILPTFDLPKIISSLSGENITIGCNDSVSIKNVAIESIDFISDRNQQFTIIVMWTNPLGIMINQSMNTNVIDESITNNNTFEFSLQFYGNIIELNALISNIFIQSKNTCNDLGQVAIILSSSNVNYSSIYRLNVIIIGSSTIPAITLSASSNSITLFDDKPCLLPTTINVLIGIPTSTTTIPASDILTTGILSIIHINESSSVLYTPIFYDMGDNTYIPIQWVPQSSSSSSSFQLFGSVELTNNMLKYLKIKATNYTAINITSIIVTSVGENSDSIILNINPLLSNDIMENAMTSNAMFPFSFPDHAIVIKVMDQHLVLNRYFSILTNINELVIAVDVGMIKYLGNINSLLIQDGSFQSLRVFGSLSLDVMNKILSNTIYIPPEEINVISISSMSISATIMKNITISREITIVMDPSNDEEFDITINNNDSSSSLSRTIQTITSLSIFQIKTPSKLSILSGSISCNLGYLSLPALSSQLSSITVSRDGHTVSFTSQASFVDDLINNILYTPPNHYVGYDTIQLMLSLISISSSENGAISKNISLFINTPTTVNLTCADHVSVIENDLFYPQNYCNLILSLQQQQLQQSQNVSSSLDNCTAIVTIALSIGMISYSNTSLFDFYQTYPSNGYIHLKGPCYYLQQQVDSIHIQFPSGFTGLSIFSISIEVLDTSLLSIKVKSSMKIDVIPTHHEPYIEVSYSKSMMCSSLQHSFCPSDSSFIISVPDDHIFNLNFISINNFYDTSNSIHRLNLYDLIITTKNGGCQFDYLFDMSTNSYIQSFSSSIDTSSNSSSYYRLQLDPSMMIYEDLDLNFMVVDDGKVSGTIHLVASDGRTLSYILQMGLIFYVPPLDTRYDSDNITISLVHNQYENTFYSMDSTSSMDINMTIIIILTHPDQHPYIYFSANNVLGEEDKSFFLGNMISILPGNQIFTSASSQLFFLLIYSNQGYFNDWNDSSYSNHFHDLSSNYSTILNITGSYEQIELLLSLLVFVPYPNVAYNVSIYFQLNTTIYDSFYHHITTSSSISEFNLFLQPVSDVPVLSVSVNNNNNNNSSNVLVPAGVWIKLTNIVLLSIDNIDAMNAPIYLQKQLDSLVLLITISDGYLQYNPYNISIFVQRDMKVVGSIPVYHSNGRINTTMIDSLVYGYRQITIRGSSENIMTAFDSIQLQIPEFTTKLIILSLQLSSTISNLSTSTNTNISMMLSPVITENCIHLDLVQYRMLSSNQLLFGKDILQSLTVTSHQNSVTPCVVGNIYLNFSLFFMNPTFYSFHDQQQQQQLQLLFPTIQSSISDSNCIYMNETTVTCLGSVSEIYESFSLIRIDSSDNYVGDVELIFSISYQTPSSQIIHSQYSSIVGYQNQIKSIELIQKLPTNEIYSSSVLFPFTIQYPSCQNQVYDSKIPCIIRINVTSSGCIIQNLKNTTFYTAFIFSGSVYDVNSLLEILTILPFTNSSQFMIHISVEDIFNLNSSLIVNDSISLQVLQPTISYFNTNLSPWPLVIVNSSQSVVQLFPLSTNISYPLLGAEESLDTLTILITCMYCEFISTLYQNNAMINQVYNISMIGNLLDINIALGNLLYLPFYNFSGYDKLEFFISNISNTSSLLVSLSLYVHVQPRLNRLSIVTNSGNQFIEIDSNFFLLNNVNISLFSSISNESPYKLSLKSYPSTYMNDWDMNSTIITLPLTQYVIRTVATSVNLIVEISLTTSQIYNEKFYLTIYNQFINTSTIIGPIFSSTVAESSEENSGGWIEGRIQEQSLQDMIKTIPYFLDYADDLFVNKIIRITNTQDISIQTIVWTITFIHPFANAWNISWNNDSTSTLASTSTLFINILQPSNQIGGFFRLSVNGISTSLLPWNISAFDMQVVLLSLSSVQIQLSENITIGNVTVIRSEPNQQLGYSWTIHFQQLPNTNISSSSIRNNNMIISGDGSYLTGYGAYVEVSLTSAAPFNYGFQLVKPISGISNYGNFSMFDVNSELVLIGNLDSLSKALHEVALSLPLNWNNTIDVVVTLDCIKSMDCQTSIVLFTVRCMKTRQTIMMFWNGWSLIEESFVQVKIYQHTNLTFGFDESISIGNVIIGHQHISNRLRNSTKNLNTNYTDGLVITGDIIPNQICSCQFTVISGFLGYGNNNSLSNNSSNINIFQGNKQAIIHGSILSINLYFPSLFYYPCNDDNCNDHDTITISVTCGNTILTGNLFINIIRINDPPFVHISSSDVTDWITKEENDTDYYIAIHDNNTSHSNYSDSTKFIPLFQSIDGASVTIGQYISISDRQSSDDSTIDFFPYNRWLLSDIMYSCNITVQNGMLIQSYAGSLSVDCVVSDKNSLCTNMIDKNNCCKTIAFLGNLLDIVYAVKSLIYIPNFLWYGIDIFSIEVYVSNINIDDINLSSQITSRKAMIVSKQSIQTPIIHSPTVNYLETLEDYVAIIGSDCCSWIELSDYGVDIRNMSKTSIFITDPNNPVLLSNRRFVINPVRENRKYIINNNSSFISVTYDSSLESDLYGNDYDNHRYDDNHSFHNNENSSYPVNNYIVTINVTQGTISFLRNPWSKNNTLESLLFLHGSGFEDSLVTIQGSLLLINLALRGLIYKPNINWNSYSSYTQNSKVIFDSISILVSSQDNRQSKSIINILVWPINDPPVIGIASLSLHDSIRQEIDMLSRSTIQIKPLQCIQNEICFFQSLGISVRDIDAMDFPNGYLTINLTAFNGSFVLNNQLSTFGHYFQLSSEGSFQHVILNIPATELSIALNGLGYLPCPYFYGRDVITITVKDNGYAGLCPKSQLLPNILGISDLFDCSLTTTMEIPVIISSHPYDVQIISPPSILNVTENDSLTIIGIKITIVDSASLLFSQYPHISGGECICNTNDLSENNDSFTIRMMSGDGVISLTNSISLSLQQSSNIIFTNSLNEINRLLSYIVFRPTEYINYFNHGLASISIEITRDETSAVLIATSEISIYVQPINQPPIIHTPSFINVSEGMDWTFTNDIFVDDIDDQDYSQGQVSLSIVVSHGFLSTNNRTLVSILGSYFQKNRNISLHAFDFSIINTWLSYLVYTPDLDGSNQDVMVIDATDRCNDYIDDIHATGTDGSFLLPVLWNCSVHCSLTSTTEIFIHIQRDRKILSIQYDRLWVTTQDISISTSQDNYSIRLLTDQDQYSNNLNRSQIYLLSIRCDIGSIFIDLDLSQDISSLLVEYSSNNNHNITIRGTVNELNIVLSSIIFTPAVGWNSVITGMTDSIQLYLSEENEMENILFTTGEISIIVTEGDGVVSPYILLPNATYHRKLCSISPYVITNIIHSLAAECFNMISVSPYIVTQNSPTFIQGIRIVQSGIQYQHISNDNIMYKVKLTTYHGLLSISLSLSSFSPFQSVLEISGLVTEVNSILSSLQYKSTVLNDNNYSNGISRTNDSILIEVIYYDARNQSDIMKYLNTSLPLQIVRNINNPIIKSESNTFSTLEDQKFLVKNIAVLDTNSLINSSFCQTQVECQLSSIALFRVSIQVSYGVLSITYKQNLTIYGNSILNNSLSSFNISGKYQTMLLLGPLKYINIALRSLIYTPKLNWNSDEFNTLDVLHMIAIDIKYNMSSQKLFTIQVIAVNDPPVIVYTSSQVVYSTFSFTADLLSNSIDSIEPIVMIENNPLSLSNISIRDVDAQPNKFIQVNITSVFGVLSIDTLNSVCKSSLSEVSSTNGILFEIGSGMLDTQMVFIAPLDLVNVALSNILFTPTPYYYGFDAQVILFVNDLGNTGLYGPMTDQVIFHFIIEPRNNPPILLGPQDFHHGIFTMDQGSFLLIDGAYNTYHSVTMEENLALSSSSGYELWRIDLNLFPWMNCGGNLNVNDNINDSNSYNNYDNYQDFDVCSMELDFTKVEYVDIRPGFSGSNPRFFTEYQGNVYFQANDGRFGIELWITSEVLSSIDHNIESIDSNHLNQGFGLQINQSSAYLFADLNPGPQSSNPSDFYEFNNILYFSAAGVDINWMIQPDHRDHCNSFRQSSYDSNIFFAVSLDNIWNIEHKYDCPLGYHWASSLEGQKVFSFITEYQGETSTDGEIMTYQDQCGWNGLYWGGKKRQFFRFSDSDTKMTFKDAAKPDYYPIEIDYEKHVNEFAGIICMKEGTRNGNGKLSTISSACVSSSCPHTENGPLVKSLWRTDGTTSGTYRLNTEFIEPRYFTSTNHFLYFAAHSDMEGTEIYRTTGSFGDATLISSSGSIGKQGIIPGSASLDPRDLIFVNGSIFFSGLTILHGREFYKISNPDSMDNNDGSSNGNSNGNSNNDNENIQIEYIDIATGPMSSNPSHFVSSNDNNFLYFSATTVGHGTELWVSDGSKRGTRMVADICKGSQGSNPNYLSFYHDILYFQADDCIHGAELWKSDGTVQGTALVADIQKGSASSCPSFLTLTSLPNQKDLFYFFTFKNLVSSLICDETKSSQLWISDGRSQGTIPAFDKTTDDLYIDFIGMKMIQPSKLFYYQNYLFISARNIISSYEYNPMTVNSNNLIDNIDITRGISQAAVVHSVDLPPTSTVNIRIEAVNGYVILGENDSNQSLSKPFLKFLIIDQKEPDVNILLNILLKKGYSVDLISNQQNIISVANSTKYDCILVEVGNHERWDGIGLIRNLHNLLFSSSASSTSSTSSLIYSTQIIAMAEQSMITKQLFHDIIQAGANYLLPKPTTNYIPSSQLLIKQDTSTLTSESRSSLQKKNELIMFESFVSVLLTLLFRPVSSWEVLVLEDIPILSIDTLHNLPGLVIGRSIMIKGSEIEVNEALRNLFFLSTNDSFASDAYLNISIINIPYQTCLAPIPSTAYIPRLFQSPVTYESNITNRVCDNTTFDVNKIIPIYVIAINQPPVISLSTNIITSKLDITTEIPRISISDSNFNSVTLETLHVSSFISSLPPISVLLTCQKGRLTMEVSDGLVFTQGQGVNDMIIGLRGPLDVINHDLQYLTYVCQGIYGCRNGDSDIIRIVVDDEGFLGKGGHLQSQVEITVILVE